MSDADRLELLDRIAVRVPELDLAQQSVEWTTLDDGHEALLTARRRSAAALSRGFAAAPITPRVAG